MSGDELKIGVSADFLAFFLTRNKLFKKSSNFPKMIPIWIAEYQS